MKKVSTAAAKQSRNFCQQKLTIGLGPGRSLQLLLRSGRNRAHGDGTESLHDTQGAASGIGRNAAQSDRAGNRDAFAVAKSASE